MQQVEESGEARILDRDAIAGPEVLAQHALDSIHGAADDRHMLGSTGVRADLLPRQLEQAAIVELLALLPLLDPELAQEVIATIRQLADQGLTLVIATHEMAIARGFADRVLFMVQGEVVEDAPSAEFFAAPRHDRAKAFLARHK